MVAIAISLGTLFFGSGALTALGKYIVKKNKEAEAKEDAIRQGLQALLRANMIRDYYKYKKKGCVPLDVKENFENEWKSYHTLGLNGVMSDIHEEFNNIPIKED